MQTARPEPASRKLLLAASNGGHLVQLLRLAPMLGASSESVWFTFDTPQSRSLLAGRRVRYLPFIRPRDWRNVLRAIPHIRRVVKNERFDGAFSTGSGVALALLPTALAAGIPATYIESVARFEGPSISGKLLQLVPGLQLRTQHRTWAGRRWKYEFSVLDDYVPSTATRTTPSSTPAILITLGTSRAYRFDSLVDNVLEVLPDNWTPIWQVGATERGELPGEVHTEVSADTLDELAARSAVVISHAGAGTALRMLDIGITPLLVPRRRARGENVDDHQVQIATELSSRGLAVYRESGAISSHDLLALAGLTEDSSPAR